MCRLWEFVAKREGPTRKGLRCLTVLIVAVVLWTVALCGMTDAVGAADDGPEATTAGNVVQVDCTYYHVDIGGQYEWTEGATGLADFAKTDRRAGLLKVYVHNGSATPVVVEAAALNGTALDELRENERHEVIWWRTWPNPVPGGGYAEVSVRLRYPLESDAALTLQAGDQTLVATVPMQPPSFRIETIGWTDGGRQLTIVAQQIRLESTGIEKVFIDGADVTDRAEILAPDFFDGICPILVKLTEGLEVGSFHTYKLVAADGQQVACTLRTLDEFLRLDMYGASDLEQDVKLGINSLTHFHTQGRGALDSYARYGLRSAFHIGETPPAEVRGHPAVYAYLLRDEPDCWDYYAEDWPMEMRIGYHGPDIVRVTQQCVEADPTKPVMITVDLTFKPANYYVYAQIPDIVQPDCYPLTIEKPLSWVRDVTEVCRQAAGPRRVEIIPQVNWEDRGPEMKYKRPPFPREVWIEYLYALGTGARGFSGYEYYTEANHHGAREYPEVMEGVGQIFRRFQVVAPLILQAHPADFATCEDEKVWLKTLACGKQGLLLVVVNDDYESLPADFIHQPKQQVEIWVPVIPWLLPAQVRQVDDGAFSDLRFEVMAEGTRIVLPELDTGEIILVAGERGLPAQLLWRYRQQQTKAGRALMDAYQHNQKQNAEAEALERYIVGRYAEHSVPVSGRPNGYGVEAGNFWNPSETKYNGIEWWTEATPRGGEWKITIPEQRAGVVHTVYFQMSGWWGGGYLRVEVVDAGGNTVMQQERPTWPGPIPHFVVTFPAAGEYTIHIRHAGEGKPGGRLSESIFVVPATARSLPTSAW
ncbi:MAG: hypothetical protein KAW89_10960 [Armatimonadetes bacterium]|nr:hypothetical protein [Armatimonadota bacterium]